MLKQSLFDADLAQTEEGKKERASHTIEEAGYMPEHDCHYGPEDGCQTCKEFNEANNLIKN